MNPSNQRRQRLHDLLLALIAREEDLPLMDSEHPQLEGGMAQTHSQETWRQAGACLSCPQARPAARSPWHQSARREPG